MMSCSFVISIIISVLQVVEDQLDCFNPFAHVTSLIGGSFGQLMLCNPLTSAAILVLLTAILGALSVKRWYSSHAAEKLGVF